ncbi:DUF1275 family protein [Acetobacter tropicalis]|nr:MULTISPECIES: DUF1275 family protein [Acetobacter]
MDALSFVDLDDIFAGAMTGNTTHMGDSFISGNWHHGLLLVGVLCVFSLAAILSGLMRLLWSPAYGVMMMTIFSWLWRRSCMDRPYVTGANFACCQHFWPCRARRSRRSGQSPAFSAHETNV